MHLLTPLQPLPRTVGIQRLHPVRGEDDLSIPNTSTFFSENLHALTEDAQARRARWRRRAHARIDRPAGFQELQLAGRPAATEAPADLLPPRALSSPRWRCVSRPGPLPNRRAKEMHVPCFSTSRTSPSSASELPCRPCLCMPETVS